jgi:hypothetical protein
MRIGKLDFEIDNLNRQSKKILKNKLIEIADMQREYSQLRNKITGLEIKRDTLLEVIEMIGSDKK